MSAEGTTMATRQESDTYGTCAGCGEAAKFAHMRVCAHGWFHREQCACPACDAAAALKRRARLARVPSAEEHEAIMARRGWIDD